jgi:hypothetical protein
LTEAAGPSVRGAALAVLVAAGALLVQHAMRDPRLVYSRFDLPAFDAYVYVAMAESPRVFTVAPWGYRVLTPALVHVAAGGEPARILRGFRLVNGAALIAACVLVWWLARRVDLAPWAAVVAAAALALSPPVGELVRNPFLADAVAVALQAAFLLAVEGGASVPVLALLAATGALAKESFLLVLPVAYFARRGRDGDARALGRAAVPLLAAVAVTVLLRAFWTPQVEAAVPVAARATLAAALGNLQLLLSRQAWTVFFLGGLGAVALLAARRAPGRALLARYGYAALAALAAPLFNPVVFSAGDVRRLVVHALPVLVLVLAAALPRAWAEAAPVPAAGRPAPRALRTAAGLLALALIASPLLLDRYRRADLRGPLDGPYVLGFCRETLRTAGRLQRGEAVILDPARRQFQWGVSDPGRLDQLRWFLGEGWGPLAHYSTGEVALHAVRAELVVPAFGGQALDVTLHLDAARDAAGPLLLNGRRLGQWRVPAAAQTWRVPADVLLRGDNRLLLETAAGQAGDVRLLRYTLAPVR